MRGAFPSSLFRTSDFGAIISKRMILRHRSTPAPGLAAVLLFGLSGGAAIVCPAPASAQVIGTMQVTALVSPAPAAWPAVAATAELAANGYTTGGSGRIDLGLARLELEPVARDLRRVRIRVDYLRN